MECNKCLYLTNDESKLMDANYRYKVQLPEFSYSFHKGAHITSFDNCDKFAQSIEIDVNLLVQIISKTLSCRMTFKSGIAEFIGNYTKKEIMDIICNFIQTYLICQCCGYPETKSRYKNKKIKQMCKSCGSNYYLDEMNTLEYNIILKHYANVR